MRSRPIERRPALSNAHHCWVEAMFFLRKVSVILFLGTIGGVAATPAAFAQQVLSPGGRTLAGPATQVGSLTVVWRSTAGINICVTVVPSSATVGYTLSLAPGGGSRSQTGPTSMCAENQTSVTLTTNGAPVTWRVDKGNDPPSQPLAAAAPH